MGLLSFIPTPVLLGGGAIVAARSGILGKEFKVGKRNVSVGQLALVGGGGYLVYRQLRAAALNAKRQKAIDDLGGTSASAKAVELATRIFQAIDGWGTDEEELYSAAAEVTNWGEVQDAYKYLYNADALQAVQRDLSSDEWARFLRILKKQEAYQPKVTPNQGFKYNVGDVVKTTQTLRIEVYRPSDGKSFTATSTAGTQVRISGRYIRPNGQVMYWSDVNSPTYGGNVAYKFPETAFGSSGGGNWFTDTLDWLFNPGAVKKVGSMQQYRPIVIHHNYVRR